MLLVPVGFLHIKDIVGLSNFQKSIRPIGMFPIDRGLPWRVTPRNLDKLEIKPALRCLEIHGPGRVEEV